MLQPSGETHHWQAGDTMCHRLNMFVVEFISDKDNSDNKMDIPDLEWDKGAVAVHFRAVRIKHCKSILL